MSYPYISRQKSLAAVSVTTAVAQVITQANIAPAGEGSADLRWVGYYADGDMYYGGPELATLTPATDGMKLAAGQTAWFEIQHGLGLYFATASGSANVRILLGYGS